MARTTVFSVRVPSEWMPLIEEACEGNRNGWLQKLIEPALTQRPTGLETGLVAEASMSELIERSSLGSPGAKALRARTPSHVRDRIVAAVADTSQSTPSKPTKYLVRATYKGLFWVCDVEGTELTFNVRSKPDIARTARRFLEGQTEGEFTVEVRA